MPISKDLVTCNHQYKSSLLSAGYRLILHAAVPFQVPREDTFCGGGDCYTPCGEIEHEEGGDKGEVVTLRWFYLRLSNLDNYVGASAKQVYVYAQTVLIDRDIEVPHILKLQPFTAQSLVMIFVILAAEVFTACQGQTDHHRQRHSLCNLSAGHSTRSHLQ